MEQRRDIDLNRARVDSRTDGRHLVSVPYRDNDPSIFDPNGMYLAIFEDASDVTSSVFHSDAAELSAEDYARYINGELPGALDDEGYAG